MEGFSRRKENLGLDEFLEQSLLSFEFILMGWKVGPEVAPKEGTCVPTLIIRNVRCSKERSCMAIIFGNTASKMLDEEATYSVSSSIDSAAAVEGPDAQ